MRNPMLLTCPIHGSEVRYSELNFSAGGKRGSECLVSDNIVLLGLECKFDQVLQSFVRVDILDVHWYNT